MEELLEQLLALMTRVSDTDGVDAECVEFGDRSMTVLDWADLNRDAINSMLRDEHLVTFEAAP